MTAAPSGAARRCVYTVLTSRYERLNEQPAAQRSALPFICFTDDPALTSETWQIRKLAPLFGSDQMRNQRDCKLRPHRCLPEFDTSLYIDNSVRLLVPPEELFAAGDLSSGLCLPDHSFRATVLDEFLTVAQLGLDDPARIIEQLRDYGAEAPESLARRPYWSAIILRQHHRAEVIGAMEIWAAHVQRYTRRDQLSLAFALQRAGLVPGRLDIDNHRSRFHTWPHAPGRVEERRRWQPAAALLPSAAELALPDRPPEVLRAQLDQAAWALAGQFRAEYLRRVPWRRRLRLALSALARRVPLLVALRHRIAPRRPVDLDAGGDAPAPGRPPPG